MRALKKGFAISMAALYLSFGVAVSTSAAELSLSPQARELKGLLESLQARPGDNTIQKQYLQKFPKDIETFRKLFDRPDFSELYRDEADYMDALRKLAGGHPDVVGKILVGLSKDASAGPDALSDLRQLTAEYAIQHTPIFAKLLKERSSKEITSLIRYLADVENHNYYPEYPEIIRNLKKIGATDLVQQFETAKKERMKKPTHGKMRDAPTSAGGV